MFTNLFTAKAVKSSDMSKPPTSIAPTVMATFTISDADTISGIAPLNPTSAAPNIALAARPAHRPCLAAVARNGRMIYPFVAPTNFSVLIR